MSQSPVLVCGEAWGEDEEIHNRPFIGASGRELYAILEESRWLPLGSTRRIISGFHLYYNDLRWTLNNPDFLPLRQILDAEGIHVTNVTNTRPPNNEINIYFATKTEAKREGLSLVNSRFPREPITTGIQLLRETINQLRPRLIIALGNTPLWALTGQTGITKWRGSILPVEGGPVGDFGIKLIPTFHPADVLREWPHRALVVQDLRRALRERSFPEIRKPTYHFITRPSYAETMDWLDTETNTNAAETKPLVGDIETPYGWRDLIGHIACMGFATSRTDAICIPLMCLDRLDGYWTPEQETNIVLAIRKLMTVRPMVYHKGVFECQHFTRHWGFMPNWQHDTMVMQHVYLPGLLSGKIDPITQHIGKKGSSLALSFISSLYCEYHRYWKDDGKDWNTKEIPNEDDWWIYNQEDVVRTYECFEVLTERLQKAGLYQQYLFMMSLAEPIMYMMMHGLPVDLNAKAEYRRRVREEQAALQRWIDTSVGHALNTGSNGPNGQMQKLFYEDLALGRVYKGRGMVKRPTLDVGALEALALRYPLVAPLCHAIIEERSLAHFDEGVLRAPTDPLDNRWRTEINLTGTETLRFASTETPFRTGLNCLLPDAEVLTPTTGWERLIDIPDNCLLAQWTTNKTLQYVEAEKVVVEYTDVLIACSTEQYFNVSTLNHRIPYYHYYRDELKETDAITLSTMAVGLIPLSGTLEHGSYKPSFPRLLVAALADGTYEQERVRWNFKKQRKTQRLKMLLDGKEYWYNKPAKDYDSRIVCYKPTDWPSKKKWGSWVLDLPQNIREEMIDEMQYWDGWRRNRSIVLSTSDLEQAEWVQTLAHVSGRSATILTRPQPKGSYFPEGILYHVNIKPRDYCVVNSKHWIAIPNQGSTMYCVSVPSSFFLVRQAGFISVTGNCQNISRMPEE